MELLKPYFKKNLFAILGAVISVIILAANTLWQPKLLQVIMKAIIADNRHKVFIYGIQLIVLAVIGIVAGIKVLFLLLKQPSRLQLICGVIFTEKFKIFLLEILKDFQPAV